MYFVMNFWSALFWLFIICVIHEIAHIISAKYYNCYNGVKLNKLGIEVLIDLPIPVKQYVFICAAGLIATIPLGLILSILFLDPIWLALCFVLASYDTLLVFLVAKAKEINPFYSQVNGFEINFSVKNVDIKPKDVD